MARKKLPDDIMGKLMGGETPAASPRTAEIEISGTSTQVAEVVEDAELAVSDEQRLNELEQVIDSNLGAFYAVGCALREIKDRQLYKALGFSRFEDYCAERWDMHYSHAKRLESASSVIDNIKTSPNWRGFLPKTESQARPLTKLEPEQQVEAWRHVLEAAPTKSATGEPKITAKLVEETVAEVTGQAKAPKEKPAGVRASFHFSEDLDDALNESLYRIKKMVGKDRKAAVSRDLIAQAVLRHGLAELEAQGEDSPVWEVILGGLG